MAIIDKFCPNCMNLIKKKDEKCSNCGMLVSDMKKKKEETKKEPEKIELKEETKEPKTEIKVQETNDGGLVVDTSDLFKHQDTQNDQIKKEEEVTLLIIRTKDMKLIMNTENVKKLIVENIITRKKRKN